MKIMPANLRAEKAGKQNAQNVTKISNSKQKKQEIDLESRDITSKWETQNKGK